MSNFAERLVARSAGAPFAPSIPPLKPRPVSRFEPTAGLEIDAIADAAPPVAATIPDHTEATAVSAVIRSPIEDRKSHPAASEVPRMTALPLEGDTRMQRHEASEVAPMPPSKATQPPLPAVDAMRPARPAPNPLMREIVETPIVKPEVHAAAAMRPDAGLRVSAEVADTQAPLPLPELDSVSPPATPERVLEARAVRTGQFAAAVPRERTTMPREIKAEPPAPTISIGKIEVQFLPQEPRMPAQRPQPERTRGFAAYARARRGEPR